MGTKRIRRASHTDAKSHVTTDRAPEAAPMHERARPTTADRARLLAAAAHVARFMGASHDAARSLAELVFGCRGP